MKTLMYDSSDLVMAKLMELAIELSNHCKMNNIDSGLMINGVAIDGEALAKGSYEKGYKEGRIFERGRVVGLIQSAED